MLTMGKTSRRTYRRGVLPAKRHRQRQRLLFVGFSALLVGLALVGSCWLGLINPSGLLHNVDSASLKAPFSNVATPTDKPGLPPIAYGNAVEKRIVTELRTFAGWLEANNVQGFIGEYGWPSGSSDWDHVAKVWFKEASYHNLWTAAWAAGNQWGDYPLALYSSAKDGAPPAPHSQALLLEQFTPKAEQLKGVNIAGMEFSIRDSFNNAHPGVASTDYFYEPVENLAFLAKKGYQLIRLPIRWERIQPTLGGSLRQQEVDAITTILNAAAANNLKVILDLHNYGEYRTATGRYLLGSPNLTQDHLADVWLRLSTAFKNHPALGGYGLMNEPKDLPSGNHSTPAQNWEAISQHVLTKLRASGDHTLTLIAGYDWSSLARWPKNHPKSWITDPANNFRYEAHHYWDKDGSGYYQANFAQELAK